MEWRLVLLEEVTPTEFSIYTEMLVTARRRDIIPNTLLLLSFSRDSVAVGRLGLRVIKTPFCEDRGVPLIRIYQSAGGAYLGGGIWGIFGHLPSEGIEDALAGGVRLSLEALGLEADVVGNNVLTEGSKVGFFGLKSFGDVRGDVFSLLRDFDFDMAEKTIISKNDMRSKMSTLKMKLGRDPSFDEVAQAVREGFEAELGVTFEVTDRLTDAETILVEGLREKYISEQWIKTGRWSPVRDYGRMT